MILVQLALLAAVAYICYRVIRALFFSGGGAGGGGFKCRTCVHAGAIHRDGVICRWRGREVFKNAVHIENCTDHSRK